MQPIKITKKSKTAKHQEVKYSKVFLTGRKVPESWNLTENKIAGSTFICIQNSFV